MAATVTEEVTRDLRGAGTLVQGLGSDRNRGERRRDIVHLASYNGVLKPTLL